MTSKEALKIIEYDIVINQKPIFNQDEHNEAYKTIEKDLEVLEIIKKKAFHNRIGQDYSNCISFDDISEYNEDYEKVKEWLENGK